MPRKKTKKESKPLTIWTLDTETRGLFGNIFRIGLYNGHQYFYFNTVEDAYQLLKEHAKEEEIHCYIHNLDFDLAKMAYPIAKDIDVKRSIFISHNVAVFGTTNDIIFHDSLKIVPGSLDKICKDFGLGDEGKFDLTQHLKDNGYKDKEDYFMRVDPEEEVLNYYLEKDCTSLYQVIQQVITITGLNIDEFIKCPTTASLALKVFKEMFPDDYADACTAKYAGEYGKMVEGMLREGYYGGRTEVFLPHLLQGFHYDVNSLYPYCMWKYEFPYGHYEVFENDAAKTAYQNWKRTKQGGGFLWCRVHVPEHLHIPPLPYRKKHKKGMPYTGLEGKLIFPTGNLEGVWAYPELEMAEKVGCRIEQYIQVVHYYKTYPLFREFVEHFRELKQTSKGAKRTLAKLIQNSLYGKFGQNRIRMMITDIDELPKIKEKGLKHYEFKQSQLDVPLVEYQDEVNSNYIQVQIAAYVTAYARILLYEGLTNKEHGTIAYCDTDSIACSKEFEKELVDENLYGKWKLENVIEEGIFLQPKFYYERGTDGHETIKAKGIPKSMLSKFSKETYEYILKELKEGKKDRIMFYGSDKEPNLIQDEKLEVRGKFLSLWKAGLDFDERIRIQKGMNLRAKQKRQMDYIENQTSPWNIGTYEAYPTMEDYKRDAAEEMEMELYQVDPLENQIKEIGFILIPGKNDLFYDEYKNKLSLSTKRKYFRKSKGVAIDVWATQAGMDVNELMGVLL